MLKYIVFYFIGEWWGEGRGGTFMVKYIVFYLIEDWGPGLC